MRSRWKLYRIRLEIRATTSQNISRFINISLMSWIRSRCKNNARAMPEIWRRCENNFTYSTVHLSGSLLYEGRLYSIGYDTVKIPSRLTKLKLLFVLCLRAREFTTDRWSLYAIVYKWVWHERWRARAMNHKCNPDRRHSVFFFVELKALVT